MENINGCLICGANLQYLDDYRELTCHYCKNTVQANVSCLENHFVCDECHARSGVDLIETYCNHSESVNPVEMAIGLMHSEKIKMHGPEHHFLVPAVLIAAYCNKTGDEEKTAKISIARKRAEKVLGGFCGTHGNCGAGVGTGIFISVITNATPLSTEGWNLCNLMTGKSLISIASHGGPRCCKRDVFLSLAESIAFVKEKFGVTLDSMDTICEFSANNRECLKNGCVFYNSTVPVPAIAI